MRRTNKVSTNIRVHLDAFIGEERGKAYFVSIFGGDVEIGAIAAAFGNGDLFTVIDLCSQRVSSPSETSHCCSEVRLQLRAGSQAAKDERPTRDTSAQIRRACNPKITRSKICDFYIHCFCFVWLDLRIESGYSWTPDVSTLLPTLNNIAQIFCADEGIACAMPLLRMGNKAKTSQRERIEITDKEL